MGKLIALVMFKKKTTKLAVSMDLNYSNIFINPMCPVPNICDCFYVQLSSDGALQEESQEEGGQTD